MISKITPIFLYIFGLVIIAHSNGIENVNINSITEDSSVVVSGDWGNALGQFGLKRIEEMGNALSGPTCFALDSVGNIFIGDQINHRIQQFDSRGNFVRSFNLILGDNADTITVNGIACDNQNRIFIADSRNEKIFVFDNNGQLLKEIRISLSISQLRINSDNQILIVDHNRKKQFQISEDGAVIDTFNNMALVEKNKLFSISDEEKGVGQAILLENNESRDKIAEVPFKVGVNVNVAGYLYAGVDGKENIYVVAVLFEPNYEIILIFHSDGVLKKRFKRNYQFVTINKRCYFINKEGCLYAMNSSKEKFWITKYLLNE